MPTQPMCKVIVSDSNRCIDVMFDPNDFNRSRSANKRAYVIPRVLGQLIWRFLSWDNDNGTTGYRWAIFANDLHDWITGREISFEQMNQESKVNEFVYKVLNDEGYDLDKGYLLEEGYDLSEFLESMDNEKADNEPVGPFDQERYDRAVKVINEEFKRIK
jgi:hypothetical protein